MNVTVIGLGNMGQPIARNLARGGIALTVFNRTASRADLLKSEGARVARTPSEAVTDADVVITMLADDSAVESVVFGDEDGTGDGVLSAMKNEAIFVSMSTISVEFSKRLKQEIEATGKTYVAAPVFGRPEAAEGAKISVVAAGPPAAIERCRPLFELIAINIYVVGEEQSQANLVKLAGNFMIASMIETLGQAYALVNKGGVEPSQFLEIINGSLFKSPIYQNYGAMIAENRFQPAAFKLRLGLKDVRLGLKAADDLEVPMPLAALIHDDFLTAIGSGYVDDDWSAFAKVSFDRAGIKR